MLPAGSANAASDAHGATACSNRLASEAAPASATTEPPSILTIVAAAMMKASVPRSRGARPAAVLALRVVDPHNPLEGAICGVLRRPSPIARRHTLHICLVFAELEMKTQQRVALGRHRGAAKATRSWIVLFALEHFDQNGRLRCARHHVQPGFVAQRLAHILDRVQPTLLFWGWRISLGLSR